MATPKKRGTATSNFGVGKRESHDATAFYERFEAPDALRRRHGRRAVRRSPSRSQLGDARHMDAIVDGSVALVVTSPPYFAGKQYEEELERDGIPASYVEYLQLLTDVFAECARKLEPGGRIAVNVANLGRKPYRSLVRRRDPHPPGRPAAAAARRGRSGARAKARPATARGDRSAARRTPCCATSPSASSSRARAASTARMAGADRERRGLPFENTIDADEFMAATLDVWDIPPESARRVVAPGAVPGRAARAADRPLHLRERPRARPVHGLGLHARRRGPARPPLRRLRPRPHLRRHRAAARARRRDAEPPAAPRPSRRPISASSTSTRRASRRAPPRKARPRRRSPRSCSTETGFRSSPRTSASRGTGVTINFIATDADDVEWYFDVSGAFTSTRGGLLRTDTVWKTLGRAHVLARASINGPLVFLTSHLPRKGSEGDIALRERAERRRSSTRSRCARPRATSGCASTRQAALEVRSRLHRVVADLRTTITEVVTGLGMCGADDVEAALAARARRAAQRRRADVLGRAAARVEGTAPPRPLRRVVDERAARSSRRATRCAAASRSSSSGRARTARRATKSCPPTCASTTCTSSAASTCRASS